MNLLLWMLDTGLIGVLVGREFKGAWSAVIMVAVLGAIGWWLGGHGALGPPNVLLLLVILGAMTLISLWLMVANWRTYRDKLAMVMFLHNNWPLPDWWELSAATDTVSYKDHLFEYFYLRHPMRHYPPVLQFAVARAPSLWVLQREAREMKQRFLDA